MPLYFSQNSASSVSVPIDQGFILTTIIYYIILIVLIQYLDLDLNNSLKLTHFITKNGGRYELG